MKIFRLTFAIVMTMAALSACQKEAQPTTPEEKPSYNVTIVSDAEAVKTVMGEDDKYVNWTDEDGITLFEIVDGALKNSFNSTAISITEGTPNTATFAVPVSGTAEGSSYMYVACSPADKVTKSGENYQYTINSTQNLTATGGFDPDEDVLIGKAQNLAKRIGTDPLSMKFHRAGTVCKLTIKGITDKEKIQSVTITLPAGVNVTGKCNVDLSNAESTIVSGKNTITLTSEEGITAVSEGNAVYFRCLSGTWPKDSKVNFEVTTDKNCYLKEVTLPQDYVFIEGGLTKIGVNNFTTVYDPNDYLSMYNNGIDFTICGEVINKATYESTHGEAITLSVSSINTAFTTKGIYFVNNTTSGGTWTYSKDRTKAMVAGTVLIGRYKNKPQPTMKSTFATDKQGCFIFNDGVKILNYRIEGKDNSYGVFQGKSGVEKSGEDTFRFQDCTFVNENNYLTSFNNASYAVPKAMYFDNCIIRVAGTVINGGSNTTNKPEKLETLSFKNTVIAPYDATSPTSANGCLFNFGSTDTATTALNIEMSYCTIYEYQASTKSRGQIEVKDYANFTMDHTAFYHSSYDGYTSNYYVIYGNAASTVKTGGISLTASYSNKVGDVMRQGAGNKTNLAPSPRTWSATVSEANQTVITSEVNAEKDYFPVEIIVEGKSKAGGASYETKYWVLNTL